MFSYPQPDSTTCAYPTTTESIPKSRLGYSTNNVYPGFPPIMADGRSIIASYQPEAVLNNQFIKQSGIQSNWEYRNFLTRNSEQIKRDNFNEACNDMGYFQRFTPSERGDSSAFSQEPKTYTSYQESAQPIQGKTSDLKQLYLSREELASRKQSEPITQEELYKKTMM
jgi:hypothetical protein